MSAGLEAQGCCTGCVTGFDGGETEAAEGREGESAGNGCTVGKSLIKREERRRKVRLGKAKKAGLGGRARRMAVAKANGRT